jgi:glycosyltransferase involved in cell wall biosynthesis
MTADGRIAAVIPVENPHAGHLSQTIDSVGDQSYGPKEVVVVDSSPTPIDVTSAVVDVETIRRPDAGIGEARREGMREADAEYIAHLSEDAVILRTDYFSQAVDRLDQPDVSAVGGTVFPIEGNREGKAVALLDKFNPTSLGTHHLVHRKALCAADACFQAGQDRGEDRTLRSELQQYGRIERMGDHAAMKDLPTTRQSLARDLIIGSLTGALAGAASGWVRDNVDDLGGNVRERADSDLTL